MHTDRLRKHVVDVLKLNRTLHLKADSKSSQIRLSRLKSLHYWNNSRAGWNPLPAGQVQDRKGSAGFPSTAFQSPSQNSATGTAGCCHPLLQEPDGLSSFWDSQILSPPHSTTSARGKDAPWRTDRASAAGQALHACVTPALSPAIQGQPWGTDSDQLVCTTVLFWTHATTLFWWC